MALLLSPPLSCPFDTMIEIYTDDVNAQVRMIPAAEVMIDSEPGDKVVEIDLSDEITLRMPASCAEDLFNALLIHFGSDDSHVAA